MSKLNDERRIQVPLSPNPLTRREARIFALPVHRGTNMEISEQLGAGKNAMQCVGQFNGMDYFYYSTSLILPDGKRTDMFQTAVPYGSHHRLSIRTAIPGWLCSWQEQ